MTDEAPVPLDPDLLQLARGQSSNIIQQYYRQQAEREQRRLPFGGDDMPTIGQGMPEDCNDGMISDGMITPPALLPEPDLNHPQQYPDESAPPEPSMGSQAAPEKTLSEIVGDANGGIVGGAMPQEWGTGWKPTGDAHDALPASVSLADICDSNAEHWDQWKERPLGPDQK